MAKASPMVRSFNAGEVSPLVEGRTDLDRYPSSNRSMFNTVAAPQGPAIPRSGTEFINTIYDPTAKSTLVPFVFSETDFYMIEFANNRVRFFTEVGLLTYTPVAFTITSTSPFVINSATLNANVGDEVALSDFPATYNLNGVVAKITAKSVNDYTLDIAYPALPSTPATAARVYHVVSPYSTAQLARINDTPSLDTVYLTHPTVKPYKLKRFDTYNWVFEIVPFEDGPYLPVNETATRLTISATGKATPDMTSNTLPSGVASGDSTGGATAYWHAFDASGSDLYWESANAQMGNIVYQAAAAFVLDGYSILMATVNSDTSYTAKDYAPSTFEMQGSNDGITYTTLDKQNNYVLYDNNKSVFFPVKNNVAYLYHRLLIHTLTRNGTQHVRIRSLILRSTTSTSITVTASSVAGINNDQGFLTTDVGRLLRLQGDDGVWRPLVITARTNTTTVTATLLGEPFPNLNASSEWRLGYWSDTTGWPNCATFHDDRLWYGGSTLYPDLIVGSVTGKYDYMAPSSPTGEVLDTSGIAVRLNARRLSRVKWIASGKDGLLLGTGSQEYLLRSVEGAGKSLTPGTLKVVVSSSRGSSDTFPAIIDLQVLYVQRSGRSLREYAYSYEVDGYKSPSMSSLASHLGISPFVKLAYAAEPYSIVWALRADGKVVGLTYNRDENVVGWHRHDFGGEIESIAVLPSTDQLQDVLWMIVKRSINGVDKRYVEKLTRFWDFNMDIPDAHFVDSGLRYSGVPTNEVYGLSHLEGKDVYGLADGTPVGPFVVENGTVVLDTEASNIVLGLGFDSEGETSRLENGAQDGTAQGKEKRINLIAVNVWRSYGGEVGTWNEDTSEIEWVPLDYPVANADMIETITLFSGILDPITPAPGYEKRGSIFFRRAKEVPLPFNIVALMPQMNTQDR